jgi:hypothetical protein
MDGNELVYRQYIDTLLANQSTVIALAQKHLFDHDQIALEKRQQPGGMTVFPIGSIVLAQYHDAGLGAKPPTKLHPKWEGPFRVTNITNSGNTYVLQNFVDGSVTKRHLTDLKLFHHSEEETSLTLSDVALRDRIHEFPVDRVLAHRFKPTAGGSISDKNKSSNLEVHIHWKGFSSRWDSWEPFKNVRLNDIVIDYMRTNKLRRFIPRNLEGDIVQDEEEAPPVPIVNRIRSQDAYTYQVGERQNQTRRIRFSFPDAYVSREGPSEKRWMYNKRTRSWIDSEEIRHLGPY